MKDNQEHESLKIVDYNPFDLGTVLKAVPTTEAQREIWATMVMEKDSTLCYNESITLNMSGFVDPGVLNKAFQELLKHHDILRSTFSANGEYFFIKEYQPQPIRYIDWSGKSNVSSEIEQLKQHEVNSPIDLFNGPCFFGTLIKLKSDDFIFVITAHHIICDGWSFEILLTELSDIYSALEKNLSFFFPYPPQFADYATTEISLGCNQIDRLFWLNQFKAPLKTKKIPLDFPRPKFRTYNSQRIDIEVSHETVKKLKQCAASQGTNFYTFLIASFQLLMNKITGCEESVIGLASAAQSATGKISLVGHLVNLLPLRSAIDVKQPFNSYLKRVQTLMLDCFDHQFYSYGTLLKELNLERNPGEIPLLNTVFNIDQQAVGQGLKFDTLRASYTSIPRVFENFELFINAVSCGDNLTIECQFNSNLFKSSTIENWITCFIRLMEDIVKNPQEPLEQFALKDLYIPNEVIQVEKEFKSQLLKCDPIIVEQLKNIWKGVLEIREDIGCTDNFFVLGGHSLLAAKVAILIKEAFEIEISIRSIFEHPTLEDLATQISLKSPEQQKALSLPFIKSQESQILYPVTHNQMEIWYLEEMFPGTTMFNLPLSFRVNFAVDREVMEQTLHYLIQRHPALRTAIITENGIPQQKVLERNNPQLFSKLELIQTNENEFMDLLNQEAITLFDIEKPPLFNAKLYQLGEEDFLFYFLVHHAIWDGWSFDIFLEELNIIYSALAQNNTPVFTKNPMVTYADYSLWQQQSLKLCAFDYQLDFWKNKLKNLPILQLPLDYKKPLNDSQVGSTFAFELTPEQSEKLRAYAKSQSTSLYNIFLTAFKVTLARYSHLEDIIVGSPVSGRTHPELMNTIGFFVNTLAFRSTINLNKDFEYNLKQVIATCLDAFENQDIPFQVILNTIEYPQDNIHTPIFQAFFSYQDVSNRKCLLNGQPYRQIDISKASTHTDLDLWIKTSEKKINGGFEYRIHLFEEITIRRFCETYIHLLDGLTSHVNVPLNQLVAIPSEQSQLLLKDWSNTNKVTVGLKPFHKVFEEMAKKHPANIAVKNSKGRLSYEDLDLLSNKIAHGLINLGIKPGKLVGISMQRDLNLIIALLGILKAGAGYVPLDPAFPQERLEYMIEHSTPKALLTESSIAARFAKYSNVTLFDDLIENPILSQKSPEVASSLKDTMYVIYTSGSTGNPKGVQISHGALSNFLRSMAREPGLKNTDKLLAVTTLSFDISTLELYLPLTQGGSLFLADNFDVIDGKALKEIIQDNQINVMQATPSTWHLLLSAGWTGDRAFKVLCGGEPFPLALAKQLISMCGSVWNMYGPTETTVWSTCKKLSSSDTVLTIGKPIDNTYTYILNEQLQLAPIGAPGELYIGGLGLAEGYYKNEDLSEQKFINNPFEPEQRIYATGDTARYTATGEIECLGRKDDQVKIRGYRIELGEIEAVINKQSFIKENTVLVNSDRPDDVRIVAFIVLQDDSSFDEKQLRNNLGQFLPKYMIPAHFVVVSELPRTLNNKIDKKRVDFHLEEGYNYPQSSNEILVARIWEDLLRKKNISRDDNFFHLGGHSLIAIDFITRIYQETGCRINLRNMLLGTVKTIAQELPGTSTHPKQPIDKKTIEQQQLKNNSSNNTNSIDSFFFDSNGKKLYGIYHSAQAKNPRDTAILLCYPIGHEYLRTHWVFNHITKLLVKAGFPVLRFDYYATGDSFGETTEGTILQWKQDIAKACNKLIECSGVKKVSIVGRRLGATLAALCVNEGLNVEELILWDPIIKGADYLQELKTQHKILLGQLPEVIEENELEMMGFAYPLRLQIEIESINLTQSNTGKVKTTILTDKHVNLISLAGLDSKINYQFVASGSDKDMFFNSMIVDPTSSQLILKLLTEGTQ